ncbi:hypothetical protein NDU88_005398 [Pleurodeles waltl]|uniref:Uncharacterized protein n=1 Tax=Pleurodeles waltl TaxID=8319 RepID=A0AAV7WCL8_PLEWA|nr:hypothetical protein NDU88_005398 [Pleurodeles waltl]
MCWACRGLCPCDGSLRCDPHNSIACADSATNDLEMNGDSDALIGWLPQSRERPQVKSGVSLMSGGVGSWSRNILESVATEERKESKEQEDEEPGNKETAGRTGVIMGQSGAEGSQRGTEDCWPQGAYS